jgi:cytochrome c2
MRRRGFVVAGFTALLLGLVGDGCGGSKKATTTRAPAPKGDVAHGRLLFMNGTNGKRACAFCHPLAAVGANGPFGPDLDQEGREYQTLHLSKADVRRFVLKQMSGAGLCLDPNDPGRCMPKGLVTGDDAVDVASFVAECAGYAGKRGCRPDNGGAAPGTEAARGWRYYTQLRCVGCHSTTDNVAIGPSFKGLAGSKVELTDGKTVVANDAYLRQSIVSPDAQIVEGFSPGVMTSMIGPGTIPPAQAKAIIAYIKTLK